jgi:hypothetical protein
MTKDSFGSFEITLPAQNGEPAIPHNSKLKVSTPPCDYSLRLALTKPDFIATSQW